MIPIISVVGISDSGKTSLIEKLVAEFTARKYRVGTVKHDVHGFDIDHPGKDSWRHGQAGSRVVAISSPEKIAIIAKVNQELTLDEIVGKYFYDVDLILTEGYKRETKLKVEIWREGISQELLSPRDQILFVAADTDKKFDGLVSFNLNNISGMADFICQSVLEKKHPQVNLLVDGLNIPLNKIMQMMVANTIEGMIASLKGVNDPQDIQIRIHRKNK